MSEESRIVLEIEEAAEYTDTPIHEWSEGVIDEYRTSAKSLARQVEALEAGREWRPIEESPKDGTRVLLWVESVDEGEEGNIVEAYWGEGPSGDYNNPSWNPVYGQAAIYPPQATHYRLKPEPPK